MPVTYRAVIREDGSYHPTAVKFPAGFVPPDPVPGMHLLRRGRLPPRRGLRVPLDRGPRRLVHRRVSDDRTGSLLRRSPDPAEIAQRIERRMADLAGAQVHATLALAAAVAIGGNLSGADMTAWRDVAALRN